MPTLPTDYVFTHRACSRQHRQLVASERPTFPMCHVNKVTMNPTLAILSGLKSIFRRTWPIQLPVSFLICLSQPPSRFWYIHQSRLRGMCFSRTGLVLFHSASVILSPVDETIRRYRLLILSTCLGSLQFKC